MGSSYHIVMSRAVPYEDSGRTAQKRRTRDALVQAARELIAAGVAPSLEQVASRASISRTTAYRYFPTQSALLAAAHPETAATSLLPSDPPNDPAERLAAVITAFTSLVLDTESQQRTMLRLSLLPDESGRGPLPLRQGRGIAWIVEALDPLSPSLSSEQVHRLALAIRSAVGIEALVWLTDVAGLSSPEAVQLMQWSAQALLHGAVEWVPPPTHT
jgi:AcrR family transcriptional regulator